MESVTKKSEVDRISALPDFLVQHILSFLPSTKEAIRTGILSKRWKDEWTRVPVLVFKSSGMSVRNFVKFTESVLLTYDSLKIKKFYLQYDGPFERDPLFASKIRFATLRNVEELYLKCNGLVLVPELIFKHASLVKLHIVGCTLKPKRVNWEYLRELSLTYCKLSNKAIESVLSASPFLKCFELRSCAGFDLLLISSNSLKRFVLVDGRNFQISCPNLEEVMLSGSEQRLLILSNHVIENLLSKSPLLKSLELSGYDVFNQLVIASKSLKRFVIVDGRNFQISCPNLEELIVSRSEQRRLGLSNHVIENFLSKSALLKSLELSGCDVFNQLVIASKSLKRFVIVDVPTWRN